MTIAEATTQVWFSDWTDKRLAARLAVLTLKEQGDYTVDNAPKWLMDTIFPSGFDPDGNPSHNIEAVRRETARRKG